MFNKTLKSLTAFASFVLFTASAPVLGDDTEIYFESGSGLGTAPQVMFHIEYTPNLASTVCTGVTSSNIDTACPEIAPVELYMSDNDLNDGTIDLFELVRASLKRVIAPLGNLKVGLLMPHDNDNNCAGPAETDCSGGGYILHRMVTLTDISGTVSTSVEADFSTATQTDIDNILAADSNKQALFDKLDGLRSPQGGFSHSSQLKEIYFELFRYLTGQDVYNGHNGWKDFGTDNSSNLGDWVSTPADKQGYYECASGFTCASADSTDEYIFHNNDKNWEFDGDFAELPNGNYVSTGLFQWDTDAETATGGTYVSPLVDCSKVFIINVLDGGGTAQNDADSDIGLALGSGGMGFSPSNNDPGFVEMVEWLHDKDLADGSINSLDYLDKQNVTSFFIANQPQQLDSAASAGGTGTAIALTDDSQAVVDTLEDVFNDILSVSTTFVAASIPVNVFNRSEVLDNAYIALFQADENAQPSWVGNIKKLKLDIYQVCQSFDADGTTCLEYENKLRLIDALSQPAISSLDGRITASSLTFWTDANGYDLYDSLDDTEQSGRDGRSVHRGGAGQQIPGFLATDGSVGATSWNNSSSGRTLYTENSGSLISLTYSNMSTLWPDLYDATAADWPQLYDGSGNMVTYTESWGTDINRYTQDPTDSTISGCSTSHYTAASGYSTCYSNRYYLLYDLGTNLIAYIRGLKTDFDTSASTSGTTTDLQTRRWITGDPLHSRPLPINYGARGSYTESNPDIRLLVGSNDGFMRMIKNTNTDGSESGEEVWAFMPRASLKIQKQLMDNAAGGDPIHPYGVDGPVTAFVQDGDGTITNETTSDTDGDGVIDKVWIVFGMRRGGQNYYAMDVTDPDNPSFMWKITPSDTGFSEMGYTFSQPVVRLLSWDDSGTTKTGPVAIFGGGYDLDKDDNDPGTDDDMGTAIYVVDAETGALVWKTTGSGTSATDTFVHAGMVDSIPSAVTAVDASGDGYIDQVYVGDTGGGVWRLDMYGTDRSAWQATKIMNLGRHSHSSTDATVQLENDRRFFHAPDIVPARDTTSRYYAVVIGSGNRAHPLQTHTIDGMFMYKDRTIGEALASGFTTLTPGDLFDATDNCIQEVDVTCTATNEAKLSEGWKMDFAEDGEKSLAAALTLRGIVYFSSYLPVTTTSQANECGPSEGTGYQYAVSLQDASAVINYDTTNTVYVNEQEVELQIEDRKRELLSGGIPSENVYVSYRDSDGNEYSGILSSDLQAGTDLGAQQWRTYWLEKEK